MLFELLHIPELFDVDDVSGDPKPLPLLATRLFALSVILRLRSSRNNDFKGDTLLKKCKMKQLKSLIIETKKYYNEMEMEEGSEGE